MTVPYLSLLLIGGLVLWLQRTGRVRSGPVLWAGLVFVGALVVNRSVDPVGVLAAVLLAAMMLGRSERPRLRAGADRVFHVLFAGFAVMAVIWLIAGALPLVARNVPAVEEAFVRWGGGTDIAEVRTEGRGPEPDAMAFRPARLSLREDSLVTVVVKNVHVGVPHNLSLYDASTGELVHEGTVVEGPTRDGAEPVEVKDRFRAPDSGTYELVCDLHPWMRGTVEVNESRSGPGTWPIVGGAIKEATTAELGSAIRGGKSLSGLVIGMQYAFSIMNVALGIFLVVLRPRDTVARLLALGMVGTGVAFNNEAHNALNVIPWIEPIHGFGFHEVAGMTYLAAIVLFPDGALKLDWDRLSPRKRTLRGALLLAAFVIAAGWIMGSRTPVQYIWAFGVLIPVLGLASQVGKFRHADNDVDRRQSRLLATTLVAAIAGAVTFGVLAVALAVPGTDVGGLQTFTMNAFPALFGAIPVILFVILIRFRLWDIDRVINRGFVYGGLAGFIGVAYVSIVVLGSEFVTQGRNDLWLSVLATGIVAVGFQPLRDRLGALANRLVYGQRETPYEVLARFSGRVAETYAGDDVLPRIARTVAEGTNAARSEAWVVVGDQLVRAAAWPEPDEGADGTPGRVAMTGDELPAIPGADLAVAVSLQGELLGALTVTAQRDEPLTPEGGRLLHDLASQAGLVLRNIHLTEQLRERLRVLSRRAEELRDSRQRIVSAQDAERRRMERDIHDGAQQHLVALAVKLRLARTIAERDPERARPMLDELREEVDEALETLRNLARGIYPAVLADRGLAAAIRSAAERSPLDVRVVDHGIDRYTQEIETAVYFCVLETLQNAAKYSRASEITVEVTERDGDLTFEVHDDGAGFDPATQERGRGLQNMADRLAALDGSVSVDSRPGAGTTVRGRVPLPILETV